MNARKVLGRCGSWLVAMAAMAGLVFAAEEAQKPGQIPLGMVLIEEDVWYQLADEPNYHFHQARLDFLRHDPHRASVDVQKASAMIKLAIGLAQGEGKKELRASAYELTLLAEELEHRKPVKLTVLNQAFSRAHLALARYNHEAAEMHLKGGQAGRAGVHLLAAAHDLGHAQAWAGGELSAGAAAEVLTAEEFAQELLAGSDFVMEQVLKNLAAIAREVEALRALQEVAK